MRVIKGSHRQQLRHMETPDDDNNILFSEESIAETIDESQAADLTLKAGEMSVNDYGVVHGSNSNESDDRRIGFAIAFVTPDSLAPGARETAMLLRGRETTGQWDLELRPKADQTLMRGRSMRGPWQPVWRRISIRMRLPPEYLVKIPRYGRSPIGE